MSAERRWSIAVLASRETPDVLGATVAALQAACAGARATIDVVVNGNRDTADRAVATMPRSPNARLRIWFVALGDKAHALNTYLTAIAPAADVAFFVDGYARVSPDSLRAIDAAFASDPDAWVASGVPTEGRSAGRLRRQMLSAGGIHGNLYAIRGDIVEMLTARGFHYPLGMYRSDPFLGAVACFSADPASHPWDGKRLRVVDGATWIHEPLRWYRWRALSTQWKRMQRQGQGDLENAAVKQFLAIDKRRPEELPVTIAELVSRWIDARPADAARLLRHPLRRRAARTLAAPRDWSLVAAAPVLLRDSS